ncbi:glutamyl-tRNA reductase [Halorussus rarus]|uniref:glutamyl-tRNA reductase n=1 Tax=Halorussus TaxID=1070314 RepID=UPI000E20CED7|nr:glutamyl-tRNA reductase [Halorussus rarus]NHN59653.1 glutamyl-tRNA reductase [Halorussus sp. JP-T4]
MTAATGVVSGVRVSHDRASLDEVEAACHADREAVLRRLTDAPGVDEAFALQTCNRFEAYVVTDGEAVGRATLADLAPDVADHSVVEMGHEQSLQHLMRVATGLESLVLGEDQILGQLRDAYALAHDAGALGPMLDAAVTKAIHVGERARTETAINDGAVSVGSAAVKLLAEETDLGDATALVVGAGEMGTIAAHALADAGVETLYVANRSPAGAAEVAGEVDHADVRTLALDDLAGALDAADAVVSATGSSGHVLTADDLRGVGEIRVVDIAQPRDVSPAADAVNGVTVHGMTALESVTDETERRRRAAAESVEAMIDREFDHLVESYKRKRADEVISAMYESAERVKERELSEALSKLDAHGDLSEEQREVVASMADALVSQLLAPPTKSLRDAAAEDDWATINTALQLFDPDFGDDGRPPEFVDGVDDGDVPEEVAERMPDEVRATIAGDDD